nr:hypothetical protein [Enterobacter hormaechei]
MPLAGLSSLTRFTRCPVSCIDLLNKPPEVFEKLIDRESVPLSKNKE